MLTVDVCMMIINIYVNQLLYEFSMKAKKHGYSVKLYRHYLGLLWIWNDFPSDGGIYHSKQ